MTKQIMALFVLERNCGGGAKKAQDSIAINSQFPASSGTAGGGIEFQAFSIPPVL